MGKRPPGPGRGHKVKQGVAAGWGGPARGAGSGGQALYERQPVVMDEIGESDPITALTLVKSAAARRMLKARMAADESLDPGLRLHALNSLSNRIEGTPVQRSVVRRITSLQDLTDEELRALLGEAGGAVIDGEKLGED